jgi:hypothetical protein
MFGQQFIQISQHIINVDQITRIDQATSEYNGCLHTTDGFMISLTLVQYQKIQNSLRSSTQVLDSENIDVPNSDENGSSRFPWEQLE